MFSTILLNSISFLSLSIAFFHIPRYDESPPPSETLVICLCLKLLRLESVSKKRLGGCGNRWMVGVKVR
ncbi:hypothetical protein Hanom_Chr17g01588871 [Helianthus anomalus]